MTAIALSGGSFLMGGNDADANRGDGEGPIREVQLSPFAMAPTTVSNEEFGRFVADTGYRTEAEEFGWSYVFAGFLPRELRAVSARVEEAPWWAAVAGARWNAPAGPGSDLQGRENHPVVHVSWRDAETFATWAGGRLPTEAEWEYAARGGLVGARYCWGDELHPAGEHRCNIWHGTFPTRNTADHGFRGTAPVDAFPPNGFGLFNMAGNVWQMCADRWTTEHPVGPVRDPHGPDTGDRRVMRGGSYLCHESYCNRYRVAARNSNTPDSSSGNQGFRVAFRAD